MDIDLQKTPKTSRQLPRQGENPTPTGACSMTLVANTGPTGACSMTLVVNTGSLGPPN